MPLQNNTSPQRYRPGAGGEHQQRNVEAGVRDQSWPGTLMVVGVFSTIGSLFTVVTWTLMDPTVLLRVLLLLCFAGNLLPYLRSGLWLGMERLEWFLFNLLAVGPILTGLFLWLNFLLHGPEATADHIVRGVEQAGSFVHYEFKDDHLQAFPFARAVYRDQYPIIGNGMRITEAEGLFGVPVVVKREPIVIEH